MVRKFFRRSKEVFLPNLGTLCRKVLLNLSSQRFYDACSGLFLGKSPIYHLNRWYNDCQNFLASSLPLLAIQFLQAREKGKNCKFPDDSIDVLTVVDINKLSELQKTNKLTCKNGSSVEVGTSIEGFNPATVRINM